MKLPRFWGGIKTQTRILFPNIFYGLGIREPFLVCLVFSLQNVWFKAKKSVITKDDDASKKCLRACVTVSRQLFSVSSLRTYWREAFFLFTKLFSTQNLIPQSALKFWPLEKLKTLPQKSFLSVIRKPSIFGKSEGNWKKFFFSSCNIPFKGLFLLLFMLVDDLQNVYFGKAKKDDIINY